MNKPAVRELPMAPITCSESSNEVMMSGISFGSCVDLLYISQGNNGKNEANHTKL